MMAVLENQRHELFAQGLAAGKTIDAAYSDAGFEPHRGNASRLSAKENVRARVVELQSRSAKKVEVDAAWVLAKLVENVERAMQGEPVRDDEGNPTGEWRYDGSVANKALELIGKHRRMFVERTEVTGKDGAPLAPSTTKLDLSKLNDEEFRAFRALAMKAKTEVLP